MDLLDVYDSSSDEDQPRTTIATPPLQGNPSREEVWSRNFKKIKEFYAETGHLSLPRDVPEYANLCQWLTYQRHRSNTLRKEQLEQLESINYKTVTLHRDRDDSEWEVKYKRLKELYDKTGIVKISHDAALSSWLSRQRHLFKINQLESTRRERLEELGITNTHARKRHKSKKLEAQWQAQLEKLADYKRINGDCNVPHHYENDRSLGIWVSNQRRKYTQMKDGKTVMDPNRMEKLEELGFEWSWYDSKRKFKKNAKKDEQQTNQVDAQTLADL
jgi:hypothetical protein